MHVHARKHWTDCSVLAVRCSASMRMGDNEKSPTVRVNTCSAGVSGSHALQARKWRSRASTTGDMTVAYLQGRPGNRYHTGLALDAQHQQTMAWKSKVQRASHILNLL